MLITVARVSLKLDLLNVPGLQFPMASTVFRVNSELFIMAYKDQNGVAPVILSNYISCHSPFMHTI